MIRFKAAYSSDEGKLLDVNSVLCDGSTPQAAVDAIGDCVARLVQHVVATHGDAVDPEQLIAEVFGKANDVYPTLPEIDDEMREVSVKSNAQPDPEPDFRSTPSIDEHQVLTCGMSLRANGFNVFQCGMGTEYMPFDELPIAAAGLLGALAANSLTGATTPVDMIPREDDAVAVFKESWGVSMTLGKLNRCNRVVEMRRRWLEQLIGGELDEGN